MLRNLDFILESFRDPTKDFSRGDDMVIYRVQKVPSDFGEAGTARHREPHNAAIIIVQAGDKIWAVGVEWELG